MIRGEPCTIQRPQGNCGEDYSTRTQHISQHMQLQSARAASAGTAEQRRASVCAAALVHSSSKPELGINACMMGAYSDQ